MSSLALSDNSPSCFAKIKFTPSNVYNLLLTFCVTVPFSILTVSFVVVPLSYVFKLSKPPTILNPLLVYSVELSSNVNPLETLFKV